MKSSGALFLEPDQAGAGGAADALKNTGTSFYLGAACGGPNGIYRETITSATVIALAEGASATQSIALNGAAGITTGDRVISVQSTAAPLLMSEKLIVTNAHISATNTFRCEFTNSSTVTSSAASGPYVLEVTILRGV